MSEWVQATLAEVVSLRRGHDLPTPTRRQGSVPVVGSFGITGWHDEAKASAPGVTIGRSGASIGTAVFVKEDYWPLNTCLYVTDFNGNDPQWAFHVLDLIDFAAYNSGSAQPSLNRNFLAQIPVSVPPLAEQRRIAAVIGALNELIESNRSLIASLEDQARRVAAQSSSFVALSSLARPAETRQVKPVGLVEHYSLPAFDGGATPDRVDGALIQSNKLEIREPSVLVSRLNPKWERCWLVHPGDSAVASTEFVPLVGLDCAQIEEVWAVASAPAFWRQMRERVTGTTGSHQRVEKSALLDLTVPDVRALGSSVRVALVALVRTAGQMHDEAAALTRARDELLPLLMSGRIRVEGIEGAA